MVTGQAELPVGKWVLGKAIFQEVFTLGLTLLRGIHTGSLSTTCFSPYEVPEEAGGKTLVVWGIRDSQRGWHRGAWERRAKDLP